MTDLTRRSALRQAAGLGLAVGIPTAVGGDSLSFAGPVVDPELEGAAKSLQTYMFHEQVTFQLEEKNRFRELYVTSAKDPQGKNVRVRVPSAVVRIFRADADVDDFTKQGGVYYQIGKTEGKIQFKEPGRLILIVRDADGMVQCYRLLHDLRC